MKFLLFLLLPSLSFSQALRQNGSSAAEISASTETATVCLRVPAAGTTFEAGCDATTNVGVGTASPGAKLDVNGAIVNRGAITTTSTNTVQGNAFSVGSTTFTVSQGTSTFNSGIMIVSTTTAIIKGTVQGDNPPAGYVGQEMTGTSAGENLPPSTVFVALATMTLTAGDWDVSGTCAMNTGGTSAGTRMTCSISTSNTSADTATSNAQTALGFTWVVSEFTSLGVGPRRINVVGSTAVYLIASVNYTVVGGASFNSISYIRARRVR